MRVFLWSVLGFCLGVVAGYLVILFGWIAYSELFHVFDRDGGKIMSVAFGFAPAGGFVTGVILAFCLALRAARRMG